METLIGDLLLRHNCVIVPSFGGFVAKQVSAQVDFTTGRMSPPRKSLLFNKQLINNDGLLINELAILNNTTFDAAAMTVKEKVTGWHRILTAGGRIELDRVGFLYFDDEKNICFEQDRFFNLLMASFGMGQVHFLTEEDVKIAERKVISVGEINVKTTAPKRIEESPKEETILLERIPVKEKRTPVVTHPAIERERSNAWKYVAAACFLPIAFYSVWIPMKTDVLESGVISFKDFNPFKQRVSANYKPSEIKDIAVQPKKEISIKEKIEEITTDIEVYTYKFDEDFFVPVDISEVKRPSTTEEQHTTVATDAFEVENVHYIVGCFSDKSNADNLVERLTSAGLSAKIVDVHNGLHRVSAGGAMTSEGLQTIKLTVASLDLAGWTLKK